MSGAATMTKPTALWQLRQFLAYLEDCDEVRMTWSDDVPHLGLVNDPLDPVPAFVMDRRPGERRFEIVVKTRKQLTG